jgi:hypothetical protein
MPTNKEVQDKNRLATLWRQRGASGGGGGGTSDHGALTGLSDDDHPQYLTQARGDARYAAIGSGGGTGNSYFPGGWS